MTDEFGDSLAEIEIPHPGYPELIGRTLLEACQLVEDLDFTIHLVKVDGRFLPSTRDWKPNRIRVEVNEGLITAARRG